jgi:hypothetical protein
MTTRHTGHCSGEKAPSGRSECGESYIVFRAEPVDGTGRVRREQHGTNAMTKRESGRDTALRLMNPPSTTRVSGFKR